MPSHDASPETVELMQPEMFLAVVEGGSARRAAECVLRTQPAVSIAISKLERELETLLVDRSKRHGYRLTQVGETLFEYATRMLGLRREAISAISDVRNLRLGRLRIGANESMSLHVPPRLTQSFLKYLPPTRGAYPEWLRGQARWSQSNQAKTPRCYSCPTEER